MQRIKNLHILDNFLLFVCGNYFLFRLLNADQWRQLGHNKKIVRNMDDFLSDNDGYFSQLVDVFVNNSFLFVFLK